MKFILIIGIAGSFTSSYTEKALIFDSKAKMNEYIKENRGAFTRVVSAWEAKQLDVEVKTKKEKVEYEKEVELGVEVK